ncbi:MAG: hypothetical protein JXR27_00835 [Paludibacteraceae bacterium]|nr:hypothetical protein [Paludibacteraceae bacterium]
MKKIISIFIISLFLTSCMTTETMVGAFKETPGREYKFDQKKQFWVLYGIIPLGKANTDTPTDGNCKVTTTLTLGDVLITGLTGGLVSSYTIKVTAKK